jgi:heme/copper-type cytochrome/quinol oxidase subunit 2
MSSTYSTPSITGSPSPTSIPPTQRTQTTVVVAVVIALAAIGIAVGVFAVFTVVLLIYRAKHGSKTVNISKVLQ